MEYLGISKKLYKTYISEKQQKYNEKFKVVLNKLVFLGSWIGRLSICKDISSFQLDL